MSATATVLSNEDLLEAGSRSTSLTGLVTKERVSVAALLVASAALYIWNLGASGWANAFYSAAVEAGTRSWTAFFFGSFDSSNFITVDKPPASLWVMEISARIFGVNSWSILVPQALEGVAAVGVLYAAVRRIAGFEAALLAGAVLAATPVASLMFRFNNPDAMLTLELTCAAYCMIRAHQDGRTKWLVLAGCLIGFGFLTKMLQAFIVVPGFVATYLVLGPNGFGTRVRQSLIHGASILASCGWWVAIVSLWPAGTRPYIGGSTNNSILNLVFGYNGFGRLNGNETGSVTGPVRLGVGRWGPTGWNRLFLADMGGDIAWLLPAAILAIVAILWIRQQRERSDDFRAAAMIWAGWLIITAIVFSYAQGIIHPYYTVVLGPPIGALVGMGAVALWSEIQRWWCRLALAAGVLATTIWAEILFSRVPTWMPNLGVAIIVAGLGSAILILLQPWIDRSVVTAAGAIAVVACLAGPGAYSFATAIQPESGAIPAAGPAQARSLGNGFGGFRGFGRGGFPGGRPGSVLRLGHSPTGGFPGFGGGGLLNASAPGTQIVQTLKSDASRYRWVAATIGANTAAGYQLATDEPVMAIGGFNGTDPTPSLNQFMRWVHQGAIHFFIGGGGFGAGFIGGFGRVGGFGSVGTSAGEQVSLWVQSHFTAQSVDGITMYDLSH